ncbi:unnamed protein product [Porites evermanni]|uniref:CHAT domain-containing protein n=1 Tax=Porites evermanni TaxID=104178 RepID=A0ABN8QXV7_9CNID|nr:unnamed protein product [Porites evermanni]
MAQSGNGAACGSDVTSHGTGRELNFDDDTLKDQTIVAQSGNGGPSEGDVTSLGTGQELNIDDDTLKDQTIMAQSGNGAAYESDVTSHGTGKELNFDDDTLKDQTIMAQSGNGAAYESDVTSHGTGKELNFDDDTLKAIAEVYKTEGNEAYLKEDYSNAVYFYTEGIKVNCIDDDLKAKLYSNRAYANLRSGNYIYSLVDAKNATDIRPLSIKPIIAGAKAFAQLKLFELAITWCDQGLAVSFYSIYSSMAERWFIFATCYAHFRYELIDAKNTTLLELRNKATSRRAVDNEACPGNKGKHGKPEQPSKANCSCNNCLGMKAVKRGDFKIARDYFEMTLNKARKIGNKDAERVSLFNLGFAYQSLSDFKKAIELYQLALRIAKDTGNKDHEAAIYDNLCNAYKSLSDFKKAIELYQLALRIAKDTGNKDQEATIYSNLGRIIYHNLGNAHRLPSDVNKAIEFYEHAISIANETGNKDAERCTYAHLARVFWAHGEYFKAEQCFKSSIELVKEMRVLLQGNDEWKISFRNKRDCVNDLVRLQLQQRIERKTHEALFTAEAGRAEALVDLLESQYGVTKSIRSLSKQQMQLIISNRISSPTLFLMDDTQSVNIWMLLKGEKQWRFVQQEVSDDLTSMTYQTYKQIGVNKSMWPKSRSPKEIEDQRGALKVLYDIVISPISHSIAEGDEMVIVPDGSSFLIPYAALLDQNDKYLSETLRIRLVPSLTSLMLLAECPGDRHSTSGALLVGNPWVETVRIKGCKPFPQLPGAEEEVKMIGQILNIEPLIGKNATKDRVLSGLNSVSLVHISAHGRTETGEIILSPNFPSTKRPKEKDFLLKMADVLDAKVHAKLVVLSCCNSGRGKIKVEGVVGIARAFLGAGARSVIATLWAIDDEATLAFMRHFYEHLVAGQSASKSLHHAMKRMRESEKFKAVKHWAPFVLIGDDVTMNFGQ